MSCILYIASNNPLPLQENPHEKPLSVREALALGITDLPDYLLAEDFDKDKPDVVLYADRDVVIHEDGTVEDGNFPDDFSIFPIEKDISMQTKKTYCAQVQWYFTAERAEGLILYLKEQLQNTEEVELWHGWLDNHFSHPIQRKEISIDTLTVADIATLDKADVVPEPLIPFCLSTTRT